MSRLTTNSIDNLFVLFDIDPRLPNPQTYKGDTFLIPKDLDPRPFLTTDPLDEAATYSNEVWHKRKLVDPKSRKTHWFWIKED